VYEAAGEAIARARDGGGPSLLETKVNRYYGHFEGDQQTYRAPNEVEEIRRSKDCLMLYRRRVTGAGLVADGDFDAMDTQVRALIDEAVADAKAAPEPGPDELLTDVYVSY
jgi:pyruvate dehydrogenase E1 component alpha subunit